MCRKIVSKTTQRSGDYQMQSNKCKSNQNPSPKIFGMSQQTVRSKLSETLVFVYSFSKVLQLLYCDTNIRHLKRLQNFTI